MVLAVDRRGIRHRYIRPRCPEQNGKVERNHRIDQGEFWNHQSFERFEAAAAALHEWERIYNEQRFSMGSTAGRPPRSSPLSSRRPDARWASERRLQLAGSGPAAAFGPGRDFSRGRYLGIPENDVLSCFESSTERFSLYPALPGPVLDCQEHTRRQ